MNAEIINLRRAKKNQARAESEKQAGANRIEFGRSKLEKTLTKIANDRTIKMLDGKKRDT